jgi:hypothetical protein
MVQKITDITKRVEDPQEQETIKKPEFVKEAPSEIEIQKEKEAIPSPEVVLPKIEEKKEEPVLSAPAAPTPAAPAKSPFLEKIEDVLQEDLEDIYFQLPAEKQAEFRQTGEETASKIVLLLSSVKVQVRKILELIVKWLRVIPHVNKYFLEQEAKIKTDKLLELKAKGELPISENKNKI